MKPIVAVAVVALASTGFALPRGRFARYSAEPTFTKDVAPVVFKNCASCHRPGGIGPFSLLDADTAAAHVDEIRDAVRSGYMPPWSAVGPRGVFRNDRRLSAAEKQIILSWADAGGKRGDINDLPPKPVYATSWSIGTPDAVVEMPEDMSIPATGTIEYQYAEVPTGFTADKWIQAMEIMPGAREAVHHMFVYAKWPPKQPPPTAATPTSAPQPVGAPAFRPLFLRNPAYRQLPQPPRRDPAHAPPRELGSLIGGSATGTNVIEFPTGAALWLPAGTILTFQMHYTTNGRPMVDRSKIGFKFAPQPPEEEIRMAEFTNGSFTIPAGAKDVMVPSEITATQPVRIWGLMPHTHMRGTRWLHKLERPDGTSEVVLDVPHYDFNWQTFYLFADPLDVPAGAKLTSMAWYDNSASNKHNPDPTKDVKWGDQSWDEMQFTGVLFSLPKRTLKNATGNP